MNNAKDVARAALSHEPEGRRAFLVKSALTALGAGIGGTWLSGVAEASTWSSRVFDVTDPHGTAPGATGNGMDNDLPSIQAAIAAGEAAVASTADKRFVVYFPSPTVHYLLDGATGIKVPSGCTLTGPRGSLAKLKCSATFGDHAIANKDLLNGNSDITIQFLEIDGNRAARGGTGGADNGLLLIRFTTQGPDYAGAGLQNEIGNSGNTPRNTRIKIIGCYFHDASSVSLGLQYMRDSLILGNEIGNSARDSVTHFYDCDDVRILNNYIYDGGDDLIGFNSDNDVSNGHLIKRGLIANNVTVGQSFRGNNISVRGGTEFVIRNNLCIAGFGGGIVVNNYNATGSSDFLICDNAVFDSGANNSSAGAGIDISAYGPSIGALSGFGPITNVLVDGNIIVNPKNGGVLGNSQTPAVPPLVQQSLSDLRISNNTILLNPALNSAMRGISIQGFQISDVSIEGNVIQDSPTYGINVGDGVSSTITRVSVAGNVTRNCDQGGISVGGVDGLLMYGNRCQDVRPTPVQPYGAIFGSLSGRVTEFGNDLQGITKPINYASATITPTRAGLGAAGLMTGNGSPEGTVVAGNGSAYLRLDGGPTSTLYVKTFSLTGPSNGWVAM